MDSVYLCGDTGGFILTTHTKHPVLKKYKTWVLKALIYTYFSLNDRETVVGSSFYLQN
jgi:hypothetical protein